MSSTAEEVWRSEVSFRNVKASYVPRDVRVLMLVEIGTITVGNLDLRKRLRRKRANGFEKVTTFMSMRKRRGSMPTDIEVSRDKTEASTNCMFFERWQYFDNVQKFVLAIAY